MRPRVIAIDARELLGARTGVGRYLGELLVRWTSRADASSRYFVLYAPEPLDLTFPRNAAEVRVLPGGRGTWWEQTTLSAAVRRDRPDLFFAPAYTAPFSLAAPLAVTIHDVSFSRRPDWFSPREGVRRRTLTRAAARRAAAVLTVSEFSRREITELYGVPAERIRVIPNGVTVRTPGQEPREPIVLYAGSIFNRRNLPDLITAFAGVARHVPDARLVIVGDNRTFPHQDLDAQVRSLDLTGRVALHAWIDEAQLESLYARASVFAFLSEYEGFGMTPLEALTARVPIVVADTPVAREIYGDAAAFVPLHDVDATAGALTRLLTDSAAREDQLARAAAVLSRYSWDRAAEDTLAELDRILSR